MHARHAPSKDPSTGNSLRWKFSLQFLVKGEGEGRTLRLLSARARERERERKAGIFARLCPAGLAIMAEHNPLKRLGKGKKKGKGSREDEATMTNDILSPATNTSLRGPWAYLVQDAESGVRHQLRIDEDTVSLYDTKGKAVPGLSFAWSVIKRWAAEQANVFLFTARVDGEITDLRLHCDDASEIANACNKGVKLAVQKHKEKQMRKRQLPTVEEEQDDDDGGNDEDSSDDGDDGSTRTAASGSPAPKQVVLRPKVKLLYGRGPTKASPSKAPNADKPKQQQRSEKPAPSPKPAPETSAATMELWSGHLREKAGSRFSLMTTGKKKWYALKSNKKLRAYQINPSTGKKKLQNIYTVISAPSRGASTHTKLVQIEAKDESKATNPKQSSKQLQLEAETLDEADKLSRALSHCLSLKQAPKTEGGTDPTPLASEESSPTATTTTSVPAPTPPISPKITPTSPAPRKASMEGRKGEAETAPAERAAASEEGEGEESGSDFESSKSEEEEEPDRSDQSLPAFSLSRQSTEDNGGATDEEAESPTTAKSVLRTLRQRNSLLGSPSLLGDALSAGGIANGGSRVVDLSPRSASKGARERNGETPGAGAAEAEEDDSPIGKDGIPEARASTRGHGSQGRDKEEGMDLMRELLISQLAKRVDYLEAELRAQKQSVHEVASCGNEAGGSLHQCGWAIDHGELSAVG